MIRLAKTIKYSICGGVAFIALAGASPANAVSFLSTLRDGSGNSHVGTIDQSNPTEAVYSDFITTEIQLTDIAVNTTGTLYGITFDQLYKLPAGTQTQMFVGDLGVGVMNALGFTTSDALYGAGGDGFYQIDASTGVATLKSNITGFISAGDIVYNPSTNQFLATSRSTTTPGTSTLFSIALDGSANEIGNIGFPDVYGLNFEGGDLLGYTSDRKQIKINLGTGAGIFDKDIIGTSLTIGGSASSPTSGPTAVPEPSFIPGFVVLGACLGVRSLANRRKSQKPIE